jgi:hypothetical protein
MLVNISGRRVDLKEEMNELKAKNPSLRGGQSAYSTGENRSRSPTGPTSPYHTRIVEHDETLRIASGSATSSTELRRISSHRGGLAPNTSASAGLLCDLPVRCALCDQTLSALSTATKSFAMGVYFHMREPHVRRPHYDPNSDLP